MFGVQPEFLGCGHWIGSKRWPQGNHVFPSLDAVLSSRPGSSILPDKENGKDREIHYEPISDNGFVFYCESLSSPSRWFCTVDENRRSDCLELVQLHVSFEYVQNLDYVSAAHHKKIRGD